MRDATLYVDIMYSGSKNFNPRIPCGMRPIWGITQGQNKTISIHASHAGCDNTNGSAFDIASISIHASHAGCDCSPSINSYSHGYFNPRIPCGMRQYQRRQSRQEDEFQSTHPMRDATRGCCDGHVRRMISIHASHAGCDVIENNKRQFRENFNPRIPCGMRRKIK